MKAHTGIVMGSGAARLGQCLRDELVQDGDGVRSFTMAGLPLEAVVNGCGAQPCRMAVQVAVAGVVWRRHRPCWWCRLG